MKGIVFMALASSIAGTWYPGTEKEIRRLAESWESRATSSAMAAEKPNVLLLPHGSVT